MVNGRRKPLKDTGNKTEHVGTEFIQKVQHLTNKEFQKENNKEGREYQRNNSADLPELKSTHLCIARICQVSTETQ